MTFTLEFYGVRGSIPCCSPDFIRYGGNTACVLVRCDDQIIVLDGGSGLLRLGHDLLAEKIQNLHMFFTHAHWDHVNGFPFFTPAYTPGFELNIYGGTYGAGEMRGPIEKILAGQMSQPFFPVPISVMTSKINFFEVAAKDEIELQSGIKITVAELNHPGSALGYRIDYRGASLCYVTDTEHFPDRLDDNILELIDGANAVIYDSQYTAEEYESKKSWGHSTWEAGYKLCREAGAKMLLMFHHDPAHNDQQMEQIEEDARATWRGIIAARERMKLKINA